MQGYAPDSWNFIAPQLLKGNEYNRGSVHKNGREACSENPDGQHNIGLIIFDMQNPRADFKYIITHNGAHTRDLNNGLGIIVSGGSKRGMVDRLTTYYFQHPNSFLLKANIASLCVSSQRMEHSEVRNASIELK